MNRPKLLPLAVLPAGLMLLGSATAVPALGGGGCQGGSGAVATEASASVIRVDGCAFAPTINRVAVGTEVTFLNSGTGPHDVSGTMGEWGSRMMDPGESWTKTFDEVGLYAFSCSLHPGMAGVIVAKDDAEAAANVGSDEADAAPAADGTVADAAPPSTQSDPPAVVAVGGVALAGAIGAALLSRRRARVA